jgi:hypothetical protein
MTQQPVIPLPGVSVPEGRPPRQPEMPWDDPLTSTPHEPDEGTDYWPEHVFPNPEGVPDEDGYNPVVNPRRVPAEPPRRK